MRTAGRIAAPAALLFLVTLALFLPSVRNGFTTFDDDLYVTRNVWVQEGLTLAGARWALTTLHAANWHPLTWLSHMADSSLYGAAPAGHHLTSVLLHASAAALLFLALALMTGRRLPSWAAAAFFAVHPLRVESVAWVAERKDVLSGLLFMAALLAYRAYALRPGLGRYLAVASVVSLGLMAKPMLVTLPAVFLLLDLWPLGRLGPARRDPPAGAGRRLLRLVAEKAPLTALAAVSAAATWHAQARAMALKGLAYYPLDQRLTNALSSLAAYLGKAVWPSGLCAIYPHPGANPAAWKTAAAVLLLAGLSLAVAGAWKRAPYLATGWGWFLVTLLPVIGLVQVGVQARADRYTYLPLVGIGTALAWGLAAAVQSRPRLASGTLAACAASLLLLAAATSRQIPRWRDDRAVLDRCLAVDPGNWQAHLEYAVRLQRLGRYEQADAHLAELSRLRPGYAYMHRKAGVGGGTDGLSASGEAARLRNEAAVAFFRQGRPQEAERSLREAVRLDPGFGEARVNLGNLLAGGGRLREAMEQYRAAIDADPGNAAAHNFLGLALLLAGRVDEALLELREALMIDPDYADARRNLEQARARAAAARQQGGRGELP